jgi:hypothetical protein
MQIQSLEESPRIRKKIDKEIKHNQALAKKGHWVDEQGVEHKAERAEKEDASKKKQASKKKETSKDMVSRCSDRGQGCSKYVWAWRKSCSKTSRFKL